MLAGYETTSTTLTYCPYVLATHPDEQQKLYDEINSHFGNEESVDFDSVKDLQYLEMFLKEVLRMYPIANLYVTFRTHNPLIIDYFKVFFF
jgi:cytochrome P450